MGADDEVVFTESDGGGDGLHILRAFTVPVTADGQTTQVVMTQGTVADALQKAGVEPGPEDWVEPALDASAEGCEVTVTRVEYREYTQPEVIPMQTQQVETSLFYRCKDYITTVQEGVDGLDVVTYRETWADGALVATEEVRRDMVEAMVPDITKVYGETVPVSRFEGPDIVDGQPVEGVAEVFTSQRATGYSASPTAKGASGRRLTYGTVAVNPNIIPYGSLLYITSDDGRFVYGYAYAADTGTAMMNGHDFIDLYYETYDESVKNAVLSLGDAPGGETVLVHDGARPLVEEELILRTASFAINTDGALPAVAVTDSLRRLDDDEVTSEPVDRTRYRAVQTPQAFALWRLSEAYSLPYDESFTDDASVMAAAGFTNLVLVPGSYRNIKITNPIDLAIAELLITRS